MKKALSNLVWILMLVLSGCGVGYNKMAFITTTNAGLNLDTQPPAAEVSVARREGVLSPTFDKGQTPAVIAGFLYQGSLTSPYISSIFAGGPAAKILTSKESTKPAKAQGKVDAGSDNASETKEHEAQKKDNRLCADSLGGVSVTDKLLKKDLYKPGAVSPFFMETDTSFGVKLSWSGQTSPIPNSLKVGYNRKEFALVPIFQSADNCTSSLNNCSIYLPAFLAIVKNGVSSANPDNSTFLYGSLFATGEAALNMADNQTVKAILADQIQAMKNGGAKTQ